MIVGERRVQEAVSLGSPVATGGRGRSRRRISAVAPGATVSRYQAAAFVPVCAGLTVAAPCTTWSLMPSLGHGVVASAP